MKKSPDIVLANYRDMLTFSKLGKYDAEQEGGYKFPIQKNLIFGINVNF
jgi:hypothetical protein